MKKILVAVLIATMMLLALGTAEDVTKSTTTTQHCPRNLCCEFNHNYDQHESGG